MLQFELSDQIAETTGIKILVYSQAGIGKTVLCCTAPKPIIISAESGLLSIQRKNLVRLFGESNPHITYSVPVLRVTNMMELNQAYTWVKANCKNGDFSTVCIDSLTELAEVCLSNIKITVKDGRKQYGDLLEEMNVIIRNFRDLPINVYMSCKLQRTVLANGAQTVNQPLMPGRQLTQSLPFLFDEVFHFVVARTNEGQEYRALQTQPDFETEAKDRSGCLETLEVPDLTAIIEKIKQTEG